MLAHVAFALQPLTRSNRVAFAKNEIHQHFADMQSAFIDFVLGQYIKQGVDELNQEKLKDLIGLKYQSIHDATNELGNTSEIRQLFVGFQKYLYQPNPSANL